MQKASAMLAMCSQTTAQMMFWSRSRSRDIRCWALLQKFSERLVIFVRHDTEIHLSSFSRLICLCQAGQNISVSTEPVHGYSQIDPCKKNFNIYLATIGLCSFYINSLNCSQVGFLLWQTRKSKLNILCRTLFPLLPSWSPHCSAFLLSLRFAHLCCTQQIP